MRYLITLLSIAFFSASVYAGPGDSSWRLMLRRLLGKQTAVPITTKATVSSLAVQTGLARTIQSQALTQELNRTSALYWRSARALGVSKDNILAYKSMAGVSSKVISPPTQADGLFNIQNDREALEWLKVTARDLSFMHKRKQDMLSDLEVTYPQQRPDYAGLIPSSARYIAVGEEHGFPALKEAFERLVYQYQHLYPDRKIIVLTEFVFDRLLPVSEKTGLPVNKLALKIRQVHPDFDFLQNFPEAGIDVIGLEDERYFRSHQQLISPSFRQVDSVYGIKQRNEHWNKIIEDVRERHPDAVVFVYTGNMHVHYRAPNTLARSSPNVFVLQLVAGDLGRDLPFGAVMQDQPFFKAREKTPFPTVLTWQPVSPYRALSGFDACLVFPVE